MPFGATVAPVPSEPPARAVVRGHVVMPDEGSPAGLYAYLASGASTDSVRIDESGSFALEGPTTRCSPLYLIVDTPAGLDRRYHRAIVRLEVPRRRASGRSVVGRADTLSGMRILLVPTRIVIDGGSYAGTVVPIHVDVAFAPEWERTRYWRVSRSAPEGFGTPVAWPETEFPIPVALRAPGGVRATDSTSFWRIARQLEADFGRSLFQPVVDEPASEEIWRIVVTVEPRTTPDGMTFVTYTSAGAIYQATIALRSAISFHDQTLVSHELMHALGFGHSTGWYSTMGSSSGSAVRVTPSDVAYAQLLYRLRRAHIDQAATHGILASSAEARRMLSAGATQCAP